MTDKTKWFAFLDTEKVVYVGEFSDFDEAAAAVDAAEGVHFAGHSVWLFPEANLRGTLSSINEALADAGVPS